MAIENVSVIDTITPLLRRVHDRALNLDGPLHAIGEQMVNSTRATFAAQGRPDKWKPLALATMFGRAGISFIPGGRMMGWQGKVTQTGMASREFHVGVLTKATQNKMMKSQSRILLASRRLLNSIDHEVENGAVAWGTDVKYGRIHQYGGRAGRNKKVDIPARPYLHEPFAEDWEVIQGILEQALTEGTE